ncbi:hypothetical protein RO21_10015 [[Actinobacillus] muris]|uniref:Uncharacterized protein n=1 Tax=Muribacter muris TaxID=67855 RepID=A0A0J5P3F1_9PAST|nr:hypothetical protein [Muribacter muris]KMK50756.1 hypothetical protein RO21_10015 [[Actinobacillus] muris] [Muribacter muris]
MFNCSNNYQKGFYKGFKKGLEQNTTKINGISILNLIISFATIIILALTIFLNFKSWKDDKYINHIMELNKVYHDQFMKNIGVSEPYLIDLIVRNDLSNIDLNQIKNKYPDMASSLNLKDQDLNKNNNELLAYFHKTISEAISKANGHSGAIVSILENIKVIDLSCDEKIDDFLSDIQYIQYLFIHLKKQVKEKTDSIEQIENFYNAVLENMEKYEDLISKLKKKIELI